MEPDYGEGGGAAVEPSLSLRPMQCQQRELVRLVAVQKDIVRP